MRNAQLSYSCPKCNGQSFKRSGSYTRPSDGKIVQRYRCKCCGKSFSDQTFSYDYRQRKRHVNQMIFRCLCSGVSQRRTALILGINVKTVDRRVPSYGKACKQNLRVLRKKYTCKEIFFDEMESFEHTKCKPVTLPMAVDADNQKILAISTGNIAAKGLLAEISRKKYGPRKCERNKALNDMFEQLKELYSQDFQISTDSSPHYPKKVAKDFPENNYVKYKGRRACVVGQGELKAGGFDPLFSLNHAYAMIRDGLKRLARRTWCTTKRLENLNYMLHIYAFFHNQYQDNVMPRIYDCKEAQPKSLACQT